MADEVKSNPRFYPRWEQIPGEAAPRLIQNHVVHSALMGQQYDENANLVVVEALIPEPIADEDDFSEMFTKKE